MIAPLAIGENKSLDNAMDVRERSFPQLGTEAAWKGEGSMTETSEHEKLNRVFRVGTDDREQCLDIEPDLRHAPLIIHESGCNAKTESVTTPREKLQDKVVLDERKSQILKKEDATRYRSACHETFVFGPRLVGLSREWKALSPANE